MTDSTEPSKYENTNRMQRDFMLRLKKRQAWLIARVAVKGNHLTFDRAELSALSWAIRELEQTYPGLKSVKYEG